jgi:hypothetical protein
VPGSEILLLFTTKISYPVNTGCGCHGDYLAENDLEKKKDLELKLSKVHQ